MKVFDEQNKRFVTSDDTLIYGIVYADNNYIEFGYFKESSKNIDILIPRISLSVCVCIDKECSDNIVFSNKVGHYILTNTMSDYDIFIHKYVKGNGKFPYSFDRKYEAAECANLFKGRQKVIECKDYTIGKCNLDYTFGLEFETSQGYVPEDICYRDGLIPLRDGSITGIEYSTVVLQGNRGLNLLKQQLDTLKEHTYFNKDCSLHIHMGGYPVNPIYIYTLYCIWHTIENNITGIYVPEYTFNTAKYKSNMKDYCMKLPLVASFSELYKYLTDQNFLGDLTQPHPCDLEKRAKWNIKTRYYALNLINMICYKGPKTVEFRFLRPSFNFKKIRLWLYILNAILNYSKNIADEICLKGDCTNNGINVYIYNRTPSLVDIIDEVYRDTDCYKEIINGLGLLKIAVANQSYNSDWSGENILIEDNLFT